MEGPWDEATQSITMPFKKISRSTGQERDMKEVYRIIDEDNRDYWRSTPLNPKTGKEFKMLNVKWTRKEIKTHQNADLISPPSTRTAAP